MIIQEAIRVLLTKKYSVNFFRKYKNTVYVNFVFNWEDRSHGCTKKEKKNPSIVSPASKLPIQLTILQNFIWLKIDEKKLGGDGMWSFFFLKYLPLSGRRCRSSAKKLLKAQSTKMKKVRTEPINGGSQTSLKKKKKGNYLNGETKLSYPPILEHCIFASTFGYLFRSCFCCFLCLTRGYIWAWVLIVWWCGQAGFWTSHKLIDTSSDIYAIFRGYETCNLRICRSCFVHVGLSSLLPWHWLLVFK